jgi:putative ABC transport system permease protein
MTARCGPISLRDLQWRRRRFVTAVVSAALAFALTLLLDRTLEGTMAHLRNEYQRIGRSARRERMGGGRPRQRAVHPRQLIPAATVDAVRAAPGVTDASPRQLRRSLTRTP